MFTEPQGFTVFHLLPFHQELSSSSCHIWKPVAFYPPDKKKMKLALKPSTLSVSSKCSNFLYSTTQIFHPDLTKRLNSFPLFSVLYPK